MSTSPVTVAFFRQVYPVFTDVFFPDSIIQFWITQSLNEIWVGQYGQMYQLAVCAWVAHHICLFFGEPIVVNGVTTGVKNISPTDVTVKTGKTVGSLNYTGEVAAKVDNGGIFNLTLYGMEFLRIQKANRAAPFFAKAKGVGPTIYSFYTTIY